jgi:hypothetical protein
LKDSAPISQATNPTLLLPSVTLTDSGLYNVVVSNIYGSLPSATANLTVFPPPLIQSIAVSNDTAAITWSSIPGATYTLQSNNTLLDTEWVNLSPPVQATGATASATNLIGTPGKSNGFYRILLGP